MSTDGGQGSDEVGEGQRKVGAAGQGLDAVPDDEEGGDAAGEQSPGKTQAVVGDVRGEADIYFLDKFGRCADIFQVGGHKDTGHACCQN